MKQTNLIVAKCNDKKKYLLPFGDWHIGGKGCDIEKIKGYISWIIKKKAWVIGMGDLFECATKQSPGASVYEQIIPTEEQKELIIALLEPIVKKGLLLGLHDGNHEFRALRETGINLTKDLCRALRVPYIGYATFGKLKVGNQIYETFSTHGFSGSKLYQTKMKTCLDLSMSFDAELYLMGHVHELADFAKLKKSIKNNEVITRKQHFVLTGHYVKYEGSYAEQRNMPPSKLGSPRIRFSGTKHDIHVSI